MRDLAAAYRAAQIGNALGNCQFERCLPDRAQRSQRSLVETKGVVIGVDHAGAIARRLQVTRALLPLGAQREMMTEHGQILEPFRLVAAQLLEGGADPAVHVGPALQEQILVDHVLQQCLRKAVALRRDRARSGNFLDDFRIAKQFEPASSLAGVGRHGFQKRGVEARADDRGFLGQPAHLLRQPVDASKQHRLDGGGNAGCGFACHDLPLLAVALQYTAIDQAAHDLLDKQGGCRPRARGSGREALLRSLPSSRRKAPPAGCVRHALLSGESLSAV